MKIEYMKFFEMQAYGFNQIMKQYCNFPKLLPLPCHMEHGWTALTEPLHTDLKIAEKKGLMLVFSKRRKMSWQQISNIPVIIMGSPFVYYRKYHKIEKDKNAQGTVAFPVHSTIHVHSKYDIEKYCQNLLSLPGEFKPITICLHYLEYKNESTKIYKKYNFNVTSAGKKIGGSLEFVENYYNILKKHKFTTSNYIGSGTFYSVEMGIPFFLTGKPPILINDSNSDPNVPNKYSMTDFEYGKRSYDYFSTGPIKHINQKQQDFVNYELGINHFISGQELRKILINNFFKENYLFYGLPIYLIYKSVKQIQSLFSY